MTTQNTLPDTITLHKQLQDIDANLRREVVKVQTAYNELKKVTELAPLPTTITHITQAWLSSIIDAKCQLIEGDVSLTSDEKKARKRAWNYVNLRASKPVKTIIQALTNYPDAEWAFDPMISPTSNELGEQEPTESKGNFFCTNIEQVAANRSKHQVPDECKEHWALIRKAIEQVKELRDWENANDVKAQPLAHLQDLTPYNFIEAWILGGMKFDRRFAHLGINPQNFKDPNRPDRVII